MTTGQAAAATTNFQAEMTRAGDARARGDHASALRHFEAAAALCGPGNPWPRLGQAAALLALGRGEAAAALHAAVLADHPGQVEALRGLAQAAQARGDQEAALRHCEAAVLAAGAGNPWPRLDQAALLRAMGRDAAAEALYRLVLADHPGRVEALLGLGHAARMRGEHAAALEHYRAAAAAAPGNPWPRLDQAAALRALDRGEEAGALYASVLAEDPRSLQALLGLGQVARERGDRAEAEAQFRRATEVAPAAGAAWIELATERRDAGDHDTARIIAARLIAEAPRDLQAWMSLGRTERAATRHAEALEAFRHAHDCKPADPYPLIEMACERRSLGEPEEARRLLLRALDCDGRNLQALEFLGEMARLARDHDTALARFREAIAVRPGSPWSWLGVVRTLSDQGGQADALALLDEAERHCGVVPELVAGRIELMRRSGDWLAALDLARTASAAAPQHASLWLQRFRMERMLADPNEVEACLAAAPATIRSEKARLLHCRGMAAEERWCVDEAVALYEEALALKPEDGWALSDSIRARILALDLDAARAGLERLTRLTAASAKIEGRSTNPSQTHFGQILDEFRLDGAALAQLLDLRGRAPESRIDGLLGLVRRYPDYTPAAMMLLIALRQAGRLAAPRAVAAGSAIPRRLSQYWDQPEPPAEIAALMQGWREANPGFEVRRFDDARARAFLRETCPPAALAAYRRAREPAQKADIFRLACLFAEGGWWVDADDRCLTPLETLAVPEAGLVLYQEDYGTIGNNVIGAAPQHPVIGLALELAVAAINRGDVDILWFSTGPGLLTRALARSLAGPLLSLPAWLRRVQVWPRTAVHRSVAMHCQVAYKTTDRHWSRTAFARRPAAARGEAGMAA